MRSQLLGHYNQAVLSARGTGLDAEVARLETLLRDSVATIAVQPAILRNIATGDAYTTYYKAVKRRDRRASLLKHLAERKKVDGQIHSSYEEEIVNAALSIDGRGLNSYGPITLVLKTEAIEDRSSVLRENAYQFYDRCNLGPRDADEPPGWRSTWADRHLLGVAKLAAMLSTSTTDTMIAEATLVSHGSKETDQFLEVHIYGDVPLFFVGEVRLERSLTETRDLKAWNESIEKLEKRRIPVVLAGAK